MLKPRADTTIFHSKYQCVTTWCLAHFSWNTLYSNGISLC